MKVGREGGRGRKYTRKEKGEKLYKAGIKEGRKNNEYAQGKKNQI